MFNTGDLGRWMESGDLEPLGRVDDQVKIKVPYNILFILMIAIFNYRLGVQSRA